jgi:hypothetical protein
MTRTLLSHPHLRAPWHALQSTYEGHRLVNLKAAACLDGICVLAQWDRSEGLPDWRVIVYDEESCETREVTEFDESYIPATPPFPL